MGTLVNRVLKLAGGSGAGSGTAGGCLGRGKTLVTCGCSIAGPSLPRPFGFWGNMAEAAPPREAYGGT
jgi:hypothetical protein